MASSSQQQQQQQQQQQPQVAPALTSLGPEGDPALPIVAAAAADDTDNERRWAQQDADEHQKAGHDESQGGAGAGAGAGADLDEHLRWSAGRPWYKRPSDIWLRPFAMFLACIMGAALAPRAELYIQLVCHELLGQVADPLTCRKSPHVEAASASLQLRMTLAMGILSVYTTGAWGALSDRKGRTYVLSLACCGLICTDLAFFAVTLLPPRGWHLPGGYNFLIIGSVIEGLLGGFATLIAAHQAYIADTTPSGTRAKTFAIFGGCMFCGLALGPILGGLLVEYTGDILSVFYLAFVAHVIYLIFVTFFLPESVSPQRKAAAEREKQLAEEKRRQELEEQLAATATNANGEAGEDDAEQLAAHRARVRSKSRLRTLLSHLIAASVRQITRPLAPMAMLLPKRYPPEQHRLDQRDSSLSPGDVDLAAGPSSSHISVSRLTPRRSLERNLFLLSLAYFVESMIMGILSSKVQYSILVFGWGPKELGEYMSFASVTRVISLMLILPLAIRKLHRPDKAVKQSEDEDRRRSEAFLEEGGSFDVFAQGGGQQRQANDSSRTAASSARPSTSTVAADGPYKDDPDSQRDATENEPFLSTPDTPRSRNVHFSEDGTAEDEEEEGEAPEMVRSGSFLAPTSVEDEMWTLRSRHLRLIHDSAFDLRLAQASVMIGIISYLMLALSRTAWVYLLSTALTSLGGGGNAAMSSLALALLHNPADSGKLFSAWSVLSAIATSVLGPLMFANLFVATVDTFPGAIFVLGVAMFCVTSVLLWFVKVRAPHSLPILPPRRLRQQHGPAETQAAAAAAAVPSTEGPLL
ncbi:hypothetical protein OC842_001408 [Tilletia horrida]|uniref:Major facilitator superfamily (MFS) profile domain-containing protein n=1 Tax=Tilletia horrida TaxID=155126 RepID=A0AAN6GHV5_9BASI|nr:hypothetical protein OC842_001408 [Tilletia horrida]